MTIHTKLAGTWEDATQPFVKIAGTWEPVLESYVKIGGVWESALAAADLSDFLASEPYDDFGGATTTYRVQIIFQTDGTIDIGQLIGAGIQNVEEYSANPSNIWVRCTNTGGNDMTGGAARNTWHQCNVQRIFEMEYTSGGGNDSITGEFTFELATDSGGSNIVATATGITVSAGELF